MFVPILSDPVVTLEGVSLSNVTLSYLDLDVTIRVENPNPVGADLQECPFTVMYQKGDSSNQIATGNTGNAKIPGNSSTVLKVPVTSHNKALAVAFATMVFTGGIEVTIEGVAVIKFLMIKKSVPFSRTLPVTMAEIAGIVTGKKKD
ncbi:LEA type 2 family protein [Methanoregula sp.]|jgi:LEA14-like dessication related protein|uniref:LEA type 2 family protein n=1 Tax=Methanoregula sp. TaxID=2052170 RepID=UPI003C1FB1B6